MKKIYRHARKKFKTKKVDGTPEICDEIDKKGEDKKDEKKLQVSGKESIKKTISSQSPFTLKDSIFQADSEKKAPLISLNEFEVTSVSSNEKSKDDVGITTDNDKIIVKKRGTSFSSEHSSLGEQLNDLASKKSFGSLSDFTSNFSAGSRSSSLASLSLRSTPSTSILSLSSNINTVSPPAETIRSWRKNSLSPVVEQGEKFGSGLLKKIQFHKKIHPVKKQISMSNIPHKSTIDDDQLARSHSVCSGDIREAHKMLENLRDINASLEIQIRGKSEVVDILNATIDQMTKAWSTKVQGVLDELELARKHNERLKEIIAQEAAQVQNKKPAKKILVSSSSVPKENVEVKESHVDRGRPSTLSTVSNSSSRRKYGDTKFKKKLIRPLVKTDEMQQKIFESLSSSKCLAQLSVDDLVGITEAMKTKRINKGQRLMQEGLFGQAFYILGSGLCHTYRQSQGQSPGSLQNGRLIQKWETFGEADVFYNSKRVWSCECIEQGMVWYITKDSFKSVIMRQNVRRRRLEIYNTLRNTKKMKMLTHSQLRDLSKVSNVVQFARGDYITKQGFRPKSIYVLKEGEVTTTITIDGVESTRSKLSPGELFGDSRSYGPRDCSVVASGNKELVQCVAIPFNYFNQIRSQVMFNNDDVTIKQIEDSLASHGDDDKDGLQSTSSGYTGVESVSSGYSSDSNFLQDVEKKPRRSRYSTSHLENSTNISSQLQGKSSEDFSIISTIGHGAYGVVDLVSLKEDQSKTFAVKRLSKYEIVAEANQKKVFNEKDLQMETSRICPFIVSLYSTFKDTKFVYIVLEFCQGGELFSLLSHAKYFDDKMARFYAACTIEALGFLHARRIIFRDLKPENVVFDNRGYCKLTDFGFAKKVSVNSTLRTYSFCGTPEYMAPEILQYQAQTFTVDLWSLGVFIFEMLSGYAPFKHKDRDTLSAIILRGIEPKLEAARVNKRISQAGSMLIKCLCQMRPEDRLGSGQNGISDVTKHAWFENFNWLALRKRSLEPPWKPKFDSPIDTKYFCSTVQRKKKWRIIEEFSGWDENF